MLLEGAKSALPPINPGSAFAIALRISPLLARVATLLVSSNLGYAILEKSGFNIASNRDFLSLFAKVSSHSLLANSPNSCVFLNRILALSETKNFILESKPKAFFDSSISLSPSGEP